jgi:PAS domain S-box-containing protein
MRMPRIQALAPPLMAAAATVVLTAALVGTISLTQFNVQWTIFLGGMLAAAVIASASHTVNARWLLARRTSQLGVIRERLAVETRMRAIAERGPARAGFELVDEMMPAMLAYVDVEGVVRYHNHSYAQWLGLADGAIDGKRVAEVLGGTAYAVIEAGLAEAMQGHEVRYERTQSSRGETFRLFVQYIPHFAAGGKVAGCFEILTDITHAAAVAPLAPDIAAEAAEAEGSTVDRILAALERDDFCLYSQSIVGLGPERDDHELCEVLLRLKEEERNHLPPGSFLPVAEEHGLMPQIDRWVVRKVLDAASAGARGVTTYMLNVSPQTIAEKPFAVFVREELASREVAAATLGFEFAESDVLANPRAYRDFIGVLEESGCRFAVSGFGLSSASVDSFKQLGAHYLKIDGGLVLSLLRYPGDLAKVKAINQAARAAGLLTVAECVENDVTRAALRHIGTDYAQGFGISMPSPMEPAGADDPMLGLNLERVAA